MYLNDEIVYASDFSCQIKVKSVRVIKDYCLILNFSTGEQKNFNAQALLNSGIFSKLSDMNLFSQAHVDYGTVVWNDELDISADFLYENSSPLPPKS